MKKAFTLAETMIVLAIIGIIASIMMSAAKKNMPDQNALMYRKTFATISEAVSTLVNDTTRYSGVEVFDNDTCGAYYNGTAKMIMESTKSGTTYQKEFCKNMSNVLNTVGAIDCSGTKTTSTTPNFTLSNGVSIWGLEQAFTKTTDDGCVLTISVKVNEDTSVSTKGAGDRNTYNIKINHAGKVFTDSNMTDENTILKSRKMTY